MHVFTGMAKERQLFIDALMEYNGTPYVSGGNDIDGADCSGSVVGSLAEAFGFFKDYTAHDLYTSFFTQDFAEYKISAMFFLNKEGVAVHVAGYLGGGLFMNVSDSEEYHCGTPRTEKELANMYSWLTPVKRSLDRSAWV